MWKKLSLKLNSAILLQDAIGNRKYGEFKIQLVDTEMAKHAALRFYAYCLYIIS